LNSAQLARWAEIQNSAKPASVNMTPKSEIALATQTKTTLFLFLTKVMITANKNGTQF
jgi:hypothetical protein